MGERTLRRLLIIGSQRGGAQAQQARRAGRIVAGADAGRKPRMLVTVALANKTARIVWALLAKGGVYRAPAAAA